MNARQPDQSIVGLEHSRGPIPTRHVNGPELRIESGSDAAPGEIERRVQLVVRVPGRQHFCGPRSQLLGDQDIGVVAIENGLKIIDVHSLVEEIRCHETKGHDRGTVGPTRR